MPPRCSSWRPEVGGVRAADFRAPLPATQRLVPGGEESANIPAVVKSVPAEQVFRAVSSGLLLLACDGSAGEGSLTGSPDAATSMDVAALPDVAPQVVFDASQSAGAFQPAEIPALARMLEEGRLTGWVHGAVRDRDLYVFTYRKPNDFFTFADFPLQPATPDVARRLAEVKRHDALRIKGAFIENAAPLRHILLLDFTVVSTYSHDETPAPRMPVARIPADLVGRRDLIGKVHAVANDGRILVIEYQDAVIPVFVRNPGLTAALYRNDKIRLAFEIPARPARPTHLWLDTAQAQPLQVLERLLDRHGKPFEAEGALVRFPQSPQIIFDVFAVQVADADGVSREYTLLNPDSEAIFKAIRDKLGAAWAARKGQAIDGRNKLVNPMIRVRARGTFNLIDRNQANAQILLRSPDDLTITMLPSM